jgi:hypothetical protein
LAVFTLITSSNLVNCTIRQVGRLGAVENFADVDAHLVIQLGGAGPIAHQASTQPRRSEAVGVRDAEGPNDRYRMAGNPSEGGGRAIPS